ncbi:MAG TPA: SAM-dependent chlorinase/fluorinase [Acidimicrobiia bacterium]|nr:SAM-dependent chlorinase/fluorinase [Acidimicrobiia bacterium]
MPKYDVISFLSDMGTDDESVGVCKAIMLQQAPHVNILDITHNIHPFDVRAGALALTRAIQFLPRGVIVAAIDPGSPRNQRFIVVEVGEGILIGPDNGILAPAAQLIGEPKRVFEISNPEFQIEAPGAVFAARDILSPAAGVIAAGTDIKELGPQIPMEQLVPGMLQLSRHDQGGAYLGEVWSVDHFGNVQLNITPDELELAHVNVGDTVTLRVGNNDFMVKYVERYADLAISQIGILVDSTGMISVVKNLDYAARELDAKEGKAIAILAQGTTITGRDVIEEAEPPEEDPRAGIPQGLMPDAHGGPGDPFVQEPSSAPPQGYVPGQVPPAFSSPDSGYGSVQAHETPPGSDPFSREPVTTSQPEQDSPVTHPSSVSDPSFAPLPGSFGSDPFATDIPVPTPDQTNYLAPADTQDSQPPSQGGWGAAAPLVESPASYFPPPVNDEPTVVTPDVAPTYDKQVESLQAQPDPSNGTAPQNVFDLFKAQSSEDEDDPDSSRPPQQ